jgi:H+/gluconate symporter-like permease
MDHLVEVLTPILVVSFALQQLLELLDPVLDAVIKKHKKWILSVISLVLGLALSFGLGLRLLEPFGLVRAGWLDGVLTALFITGGTTGFKDLIKWVSYKQEAARLAAERGAAEGPDDRTRRPGVR